MRTILVTGITGFIAKKIAHDLLAQGDAVRGTLRSPAREDEVRAAMADLPAEALARLSFAKADLLSDDGWAGAMAGVDAVLHTASPFPLSNPKDDSSIITPAVEGTRRVIDAALGAGVGRVVLTSSMEAIMHGAPSNPMTEDDWSDPAAPSAVAYTRSKIFAEEAAWKMAAQHPALQLTVINPGMVLGTPVDDHTGSSVAVLARLLAGKDPMLPDLHLPVVDLADVSACHIRALDRPKSIGNRYICADRFMSMVDIAAALDAAFPDRRITTRTAPNWLIRLLGRFDRELALIRHLVGIEMTLDNSAARNDLGVVFHPAPEAAVATARFLIAQHATA